MKSIRRTAMAIDTRVTFVRSSAMLLGLFFVCAGAAAAIPPVTQQLQAIPLSSYPNGQAMMQQALNQLVLDIDVRFLDKTYEKDIYARDPITGSKVRISCVRFRADSGFRVKSDPPKFSLNTGGLTVTQNIARVRADSLSYKFQLGPCAWVGAGLGVQLTDVKAVYKVRPMLTFDDKGYCRLKWSDDANSLAIAIGDLNIIGVQNDLDKLGKDAVREAINATLYAGFGNGLRGALNEIVIDTCGDKGIGIKTR
jgi:hypothetical protein